MIFRHISDRSSADLKTLGRILNIHDKVRASLYPSKPRTGARSELILQLRKKAPSRSDWAVHDHCSAVMRLYAIFEEAVEDLVKEYLAGLPSLYPSYVQLPAATTTQHRVGVAHILQRLGKDGLYSNLNEATVVGGLAAGNQGQPYTLFADAFLTDAQNYRSELVNKVFRTLGFEDIWSGLENLRALKDFMQTRDATENPSGLLKKIVDERNLASHSRISNVWARRETAQLSNFIKIVICGLCEIVGRHAVLLKRDLGDYDEVALVAHRYSGFVRGLVLRSGSVGVREMLIAVEPERVSAVRLVSLRRFEKPIRAFEAHDGDELGACFNCSVPTGTILLRERAKATDEAGATQAPHPTMESVESDDDVSLTDDLEEPDQSHE